MLILSLRACMDCFSYFFMFLWRMRTSLAYVDCSLLWQCVLSINAFHHLSPFSDTYPHSPSLEENWIAVVLNPLLSLQAPSCIHVHLFCTIIHTSFSLWKKKSFSHSAVLCLLKCYLLKMLHKSWDMSQTLSKRDDHATSGILQH